MSQQVLFYQLPKTVQPVTSLTVYRCVAYSSVNRQRAGRQLFFTLSDSLLAQPLNTCATHLVLSQYIRLCCHLLDNNPFFQVQPNIEQCTKHTLGWIYTLAAPQSFIVQNGIITDKTVGIYEFCSCSKSTFCHLM